MSHSYSRRSFVGGTLASVFDHRFGLADREPVELVPMTAFAHDDLDPAECHGDLLLQLNTGDMNDGQIA